MPKMGSFMSIGGADGGHSVLHDVSIADSAQNLSKFGMDSALGTSRLELLPDTGKPLQVQINAYQNKIDMKKPRQSFLDKFNQLSQQQAAAQGQFATLEDKVAALARGRDLQKNQSLQSIQRIPDHEGYNFAQDDDAALDEVVAGSELPRSPPNPIDQNLYGDKYDDRQRSPFRVNSNNASTSEMQASGQPSVGRQQSPLPSPSQKNIKFAKPGVFLDNTSNYQVEQNEMVRTHDEAAVQRRMER